MLSQENKIFYTKLIAIALPIAIQNFITSSLNIIDTFMISGLGETSIAGVGAANKVFFLLNLILFGTSSGTAIFASQYWGKKDILNIRRILGICLFVGIGSSILFSIGAILFPKQIMFLLSNETPVIIEGSQYLRILGTSYIFTAITFSYVFILRSTNRVKIPMLITIFAILLNTFLNWVLIYGHLGFKAYGVRGAAVATVIARVLECLILLIVTYRLRLPAAAKLRELVDVNGSYIKTYFKTVLPVIGNEFMWALGVTMYAIVYGRMGQEVMASITITQTIEQLSMVLFFGICNACAVILGNEIGANEEKRAHQYAIKFLRVNVGLAIIGSILLYFLSSHITTFFNVSETSKMNIQNCIIVFCLFLPAKVFNLTTIVGILRSGGDTTFAMFLDMFGVWLIGVPLSFVTGLILKLDIQYVYAFVLFEEVVKLLFGVYRISSKKWLNNLITH